MLYPANYQYLEQTTMFVADKHLLAEQASQTGGCAEIAANFLIQYFDIPYAGLLITMAVLLSVAVLLESIIAKVTGCGHFSRWSLLCLPPAIALFPLHYNINYSYAGTIAMLVVVAALRLALCPRKLWMKLLLGAILSPIVYHICGPMPYYNHLLAAPSIIYLSWKCLIAVLVITVLLPRMKFMCKDLKLLKLGIPILVLAYCTYLYQGLMRICINKDDEFLKELHYLARDKQWDEITDKCKHHNMSSLLFQNYAYMAWAEKGELLNHVGNYPSPNFRAIVADPNHTPHVSAMLSDIYYSMGHISFAQRHAFEANEMYGGYSPRMLQMLVKTNIIFGSYDVAKKYLRVLEKSRYHEWAEDMSRFLYNDEAVLADAELGSKRRCIFPDNRFAASKGLDDDLLLIIQANPEHSITKDYLNAMLLLNGRAM